MAIEHGERKKSAIVYIMCTLSAASLIGKCRWKKRRVCVQRSSLMHDDELGPRNGAFSNTPLPAPALPPRSHRDSYRPWHI
jgi:hypothetical protein